MGDAGAWAAVPEIADYEVRRELLRLEAASSLARLDALGQSGYEPITTPIMQRAAELWASLRRRGRPLADRHAIDADVILAATAESVAARGHQVIVATTNARHLVGLVNAANWEDIAF